MKRALRRAAAKVADTIREMNEAQRLMLTLQTSAEAYAPSPGSAPGDYAEFLARTSGVLRHEPPAGKRARQASRDHAAR